MPFASQRMDKKMRKLHKFSPTKKIGLIAGNGKLPEEVIKSCVSSGREVFVIYLQGSGVPPESLSQVPHIKLSIGSVGKAIRTLRAEGVSQLVMAGGLKRPKLMELKPDAGGIKLLAQISASKFSGDNSLLVTVIKFFESSGFEIIGVDKILGKVLVPEGLLGSVEPSKSALVDVNLGAGGVLVKMKKPMQDARIDLPTIGVDTIINAHKAGLRGIAVEAGSALIVEKEKVVETADKLGLFVLGIKAN